MLCAMEGCDEKLCEGESQCECGFRICKDCFFDCSENGGGYCPGCKEPYRVSVSVGMNLREGVIMGSESPIVVVLSGSMEPGFKKGDILFLHMNKDPIRAGEIVVFNVEGRSIPIVHRVIKVHERRDTGEVDVLTKGDSNPDDDRMLYARGQLWIQQHHIMGRALGFLPYIGWATIIMTEKPIIKYILIGALGLLAVTSKN